jgi:hypothetical protein
MGDEHHFSYETNLENNNNNNNNNKITGSNFKNKKTTQYKI